MTPKAPPWLVTHISHSTLGDRACPLGGTQPPRQAAWHAPPVHTPLLFTCRAGYPPAWLYPPFPSTPCLPAPSPPQHSTAHSGTWHLLGRGCSRHPILGQGGLAGGLEGAKFPGQHSMRPRYRVPQAQLPLAHSGKARGKDVAFPCEDGPHGPQPFVGGKPLLERGGDSQHGAWEGGKTEGVRIYPPKQPWSPIP